MYMIQCLYIPKTIKLSFTYSYIDLYQLYDCKINVYNDQPLIYEKYHDMMRSLSIWPRYIFIKYK